jgi:hypothetical protein
MKKTLLKLIVPAIFIALAVVACSNPSGGERGGGDGGPYNLAGTSWKATVGGYPQTFSFTSGSAVTLSYNSIGISLTGTYSISGNSVTITINGSANTGYISGNIFTFAATPYTKVG